MVGMHNQYRTLKRINVSEVSSPVASILLRVRNEGRHLPGLIATLRQQSIYRNVEVVVLDSGSTDDTINLALGEGWTIYQIEQSEFSFGDSCNLICSLARADIMFFFSGHVRLLDCQLLQEAVDLMRGGCCKAGYFRQVPNDIAGHSAYDRAFLRRRFPVKPLALLSRDKSSFSNAASVITRSAWREVSFPSVIASEDVLWLKLALSDTDRVAYFGSLAVGHSHDETPGQISKRVAINMAAQNRRFLRVKSLGAFLGVFYFTFRESKNFRESVLYGAAHSYGYWLGAKMRRKNGRLELPSL